MPSQGLFSTHAHAYCICATIFNRFFYRGLCLVVEISILLPGFSLAWEESIPIDKVKSTITILEKYLQEQNCTKDEN